MVSQIPDLGQLSQREWVQPITRTGRKSDPIAFLMPINYLGRSALCLLRWSQILEVNRGMCSKLQQIGKTTAGRSVNALVNSLQSMSPLPCLPHVFLPHVFLPLSSLPSILSVLVDFIRLQPKLHQDENRAPQAGSFADARECLAGAEEDHLGQSPL